MKLDNYTLKILESFSTINNSIVISPGNTLRTIPESKAVLAEANIPFSFPIEFGIYDLRQFLGCVSIMKDPSVEFTEKFLIISDGNNSIRYTYTDPARITSPKKQIKMTEADISFEMSDDTLKNIIKSASILSVQDIQFVGENGKIIARVTDKENPTSNAANFELGEADIDFVANLKLYNLKLIPGSYKISITHHGFSLFECTSSDQDLFYYVAIESDSQF